MPVIIAAGATPRTVTLTGGGALITTLNTGRYTVPLTMTNASTHAHHNDYRAILADNAGQGGLWFSTPTDAIGLFRADNGAAIFERACTWTAGATPFIDIDMATGTATVTGCTTGNGTFSFTPATVFQAGTLGVGSYPPNSGFDLAASIGAIESVVTTVDRAAAITAVAAAVITGTIDSDTGETERSASLAATASATIVGHRTVNRSAGATAVASATIIGTTPNPVTLGDHDWESQIYGSGETPISLTLETTAGSTFLLWRGGRLDDQETAPTDNKSNTFVRVGASEELPDWPDYGGSRWIARNANGGASHTFSCNVTTGDEHTILVAEFMGENLHVEDHSFVQYVNAGAIATRNGAAVTLSVPGYVVVDWLGSGPTQNGDHVVSATINGTPMVYLGGHTFDHEFGYVQGIRLVLALPAGTYTPVVTASPTQGMQIYTTALSTADRSVLADATAAATIVGHRDVHRSSSSSATAAATITGTREAPRTASMSATAAATIVGTREISRSASSSATAAATIVGTRDAPRAASASATAAATIVGHRDVHRSSSSSATAAATIVGTRELVGTIESSADLSAVAAATIVGTRDVPRTSSAIATAAATIVGHRDVHRSSSSSATAAAVIVGTRTGTAPIDRSASVSAVAAAVIRGKVGDSVAVSGGVTVGGSATSLRVPVVGAPRTRGRVKIGD